MKKIAKKLVTLSFVLAMMLGVTFTNASTNVKAEESIFTPDGGILPPITMNGEDFTCGGGVNDYILTNVSVNVDIRSWKVESGSLPKGTTRAVVDKENVCLNNVPKEAGTYKFTLSVNDEQKPAVKHTTKEFTIIVEGIAHNVSLSKYGEGVVTSNVEKAKYGDIVTLTPTPAEGYEFIGWNSTDVVLDENNSFVMPDYEVSVEAVFFKTVTNTFLEGANSTWNKSGTDSALYFLVDADLFALSEVRVKSSSYDSKIGANDYVMDATSGDFMLQKDYLNSLAAGEYELTLMTAGINISTKFTVSEGTAPTPTPTPTATKSPKTNATNPVGAFALMMLVGSAVVVLGKKKSEMN